MWNKSGLVVAASIAYILLLPILGFLIATFLFLLFLGNLIELRRWKTVLIVSALSAGISYLVFGVWLLCQFPKGFFNF